MVTGSHFKWKNAIGANSYCNVGNLSKAIVCFKTLKIFGEAVMPAINLFERILAFKIVAIAAGLVFLIGCAAQQQPPRDVSEVSSADTVLIFGPSTSDASEEGIKITYAQASMGFDSGCNPNQTFSDELNDCAKLPEEVKTLALDHCAGFGLKALFMGNSTNWLQQTVSNFTCD